MALSIGTLLSELSAYSVTSPVGRLLPVVLLAFAVLVVVAIVLGLKHSRSRQEDEERESPDD